MMATPLISVAFTKETPVESNLFGPEGLVHTFREGYHAIWGAWVTLRAPVREYGQPWGWDAYARLMDVMDRQRGFIANLARDVSAISPAQDDLRTVSLRYICRGKDAIDVGLLGKVFAPDEGQARTLATEWWTELRAVFPSDYGLLPITLPEDLDLLMGRRLSGEPSHCRTAEVRRYEMYLPGPEVGEVTGRDYVLFPFAWNARSMEMFWHTMAMLPGPSLASITVRPTYLHEAEELYLRELHQRAISRATGTKPCRQPLEESVATWYAGYLAQLQSPLLTRIQILADEVAVCVLARAMGVALTSLSIEETKPDSPMRTYATAMPEAAELTTATRNLELLEFGEWGEDLAPQPYRRLRYLLGIAEVHSAFRLPTTAEDGIAQVDVGRDPSLNGCKSRVSLGRSGDTLPAWRYCP